MNRITDIDLKRYRQVKGYPNWFNVFLSSPGYRFMLLFRLCNRWSKYSIPGFIGRLWYKKLQVKFGFQIPNTTKIGKGLFLGHFGNIVVNQGVIIGDNCNVAQGVTLGYVSRGEKQGCPMLGNQVWIGANAVIVGNIKIGNNVLIAPLTFVNVDIPDNAVVVGNPAKVVSMTGTEGYVKNPV